MNALLTRTRVAAGAAVLLAFLIVPLAFAGSGSSPESTASGAGKKIRKLTQRVAALEQQIASLTGEQGGGRPPTGAAGGDLAGTYPNPLVGPNAIGSNEVQANSLIADDLNTDSVAADEIAADAVGSSEIAADAVGSSEIAAGAVGSSEIGAGAVGGSEIAGGAVSANEIGDNMVARAADVAVPGGGTAENGSYNTRATTASCLPGEEVVSGGAFWVTGADDDQELWISELQVATGTEQVSARGGNDSGTAETLQVQAYCLV